MGIQQFAKYSPAVLRIGLSLVILWFGISQVMDSGTWIGYLPEFIFNLPISPKIFVLVNGISEIVLGGLLIAGLFTRVVASLLVLHLLGITISLGYNEIAVRDFGLTMGMVALLLQGPDEWCLEKKGK